MARLCLFKHIFYRQSQGSNGEGNNRMNTNLNEIDKAIIKWGLILNCNNTYSKYE